MKEYTGFVDALEAPLPVRNFLAAMLNNAESWTDFNEALGGSIFLVEDLEDISEITVDYSTGVTAADEPLPLDLATWVDEDQTYAFFFLSSNDAGGPAYFVPKDIVEQSEFLEEIMAITGIV